MSEFQPAPVRPAISKAMLDPGGIPAYAAGGAVL
jgi:hypothetical protein